MELLDENKKAKYFNEIARDKNVEDLDKVFELVDEAAHEGKYEVDLGSRISLTDIQVKTLTNMGFSVTEDYPEDGEWNLDWEDIDDDED